MKRLSRSMVRLIYTLLFVMPKPRPVSRSEIAIDAYQSSIGTVVWPNEGYNVGSRSWMWRTAKLALLHVEDDDEERHGC